MEPRIDTENFYAILTMSRLSYNIFEKPEEPIGLVHYCKGVVDINLSFMASNGREVNNLVNECITQLKSNEK